MRHEPCARASQAGFTFLGLMFAVMLMGLLAAAASVTVSFALRRDAEAQLLFVGRAYGVAIGSYVKTHAKDAQPYPTDLAQLLQDPRSLTPAHYLRRLYFDPITGRDEWGLVRSPEGGIIGVHSLSPRAPVRRHSDGAKDGIDFEHARTYQDWVFGPLSASDISAGGGSTSGPDDDAGIPAVIPPKVELPAGD